MRLSRFSTASGIVFSLAVLAACGGGGGGGTVTPPGGGNGGGNATPTPAVSATPTPGGTSGPTASPAPTPTAVQTATPSPVPTSSSSPGPTPTPNRTTTVLTGDGEVNGTDDLIKSSSPNTHSNNGEGNLMPGDPGATPQGGGQGNAVAGSFGSIPCNTTMSNDYHVHAFVGIIVNGQEVALPDGIGMVNPSGDGPYQPPNPGATPIPNQEMYADCFYFIHTHDASGLVHLEAPSSFTGVAPCGAQATPQYSVLCTGSYFTLGDLLNVWGVSLSPTNFGPFSGQVGIYATAPQYGQCPPGPCYTGSNQYIAMTDSTQWTSIPLYHLTAIWIVVGQQPAQPSALPNIEWVNGGSN
jgi:hypothetical protein